MIDFKSQSGEFILSCLKGYSSLGIDTSKFLASEVFLLIDLAELKLVLLVLLVLSFKVLNFLIDIGDLDFELTDSLLLLSDTLDYDSNIRVLLLFDLSQTGNSTFILIKFTLHGF